MGFTADLGSESSQSDEIRGAFRGLATSLDDLQVEAQLSQEAAGSGRSGERFSDCKTVDKVLRNLHTIDLLADRGLRNGSFFSVEAPSDGWMETYYNSLHQKYRCKKKKKAAFAGFTNEKRCKNGFLISIK